jgi:hypothetical protein
LRTRAQKCDGGSRAHSEGGLQVGRHDRRGDPVEVYKEVSEGQDPEHRPSVAQDFLYFAFFQCHAYNLPTIGRDVELLAAY